MHHSRSKGTRSELIRRFDEWVAAHWHRLYACAEKNADPWTDVDLLLALAPLHSEEAPATLRPATPECWELVTDIYLGIDVRELTRDERRTYGKKLAYKEGLLITCVAPGSPAEKAGFRAGELLLHVDGARLASPADLYTSLRYVRPGDRLHFVLYRDGARKMVSLVTAGRETPVVVGYLRPPRMAPERVAELKRRQIAIARLLAGDEPPPLDSLHEQMMAFSRMLGGRCITVTMQKNGERSRSELREQGERLPDAMRMRLREILDALGDPG